MTLEFLLKCNSTNFPKREELLLRVVLAFPNDSRSGLAARIRDSRSATLPPPPENYYIIYIYIYIYYIMCVWVGVRT